MNRRSFLVLAGLTGGGLLAGCSSLSRQSVRGASLAANKRSITLNAWLRLDTDGWVTVTMSKSEMGQGVHTALLMLVAEELDCGWSALRFEDAPIEPVYGNISTFAEGVPFRADDHSLLARSARWVMTSGARQLGFVVTGGSSSLRDLWWPLRQAAAATRACLIAGVARHWECEPSAVTVSEGRFALTGGREMGLGEAVALLGPEPRPPGEVVLKAPAAFKIIGHAVPRLEAKAKTEGSATFGIDVRVPGMLYAAVRMSPVRGGRVLTHNETKARALPGVRGVVAFEPTHEGSGGVAVVADGWWQARKALEALEIQFDDGPMRATSSAEVMATLSAALTKSRGFAYWKSGNAKQLIAASSRTLEAEYSAPFLAHATMEPMNCTVEYQGDRATVWAPTQVPGFARRAAAKALDLAEDRVEVKVTYLGGGFGRRLEVDFVAQAAAIARHFPGRAVQTLWSREDDLRHDFYRPACVSRFTAALDREGRIAAWDNVSASQAIVSRYLPRAAGLPFVGPDKSSAEGAFDAAYEFPAVRVGQVRVDLPVPIGFWRAVGHSHQAFFKESFLDECAHAAGADPLAYRLALLQQHPRQRAVLALAAERAAWGQPLAPASDGAPKARGIALHESFGSVVAQVAEVSVGKDGAVRVHRVVCAIDCGFPVNPNLITQQIESAVVFGLSAALHGKVDIEKGQVQPGNFHDYPPLRLDACPVIETHIVPSLAPPEGVGEPGLPPIAPALANALFALTGTRLRHLPLRLPA